MARKTAFVNDMILQSLKQNQQTVSPIVKSLTILDDEMKEILENTKLEQHEKIQLFSQVLQQYRNTRDNLDVQTKSTPAIILESNISDALAGSYRDADIIETIPSTFKNKARNLLRIIKADDRMKWNKHGVVTYNGETLNNSNIIDLVNDVVRQRKHSQPEGWRQFAHALHTLNVPKDLIGNPRRKNVNIHEKPSTSDQAVQWDNI